MSEYVTKARKQYNSYLELYSQIKAKLDEQKVLHAELDGLGLMSIGRRRKLKTQLAALTEEIEELRFEERDIIQGFDKEDAAGMKQVKSVISGAEADMVRLGKDETTLTAAIKKEREKFTGLKEQAAELTDARLAFRLQMEAQAKDRNRGAMSSGKVSFWNSNLASGTPTSCSARTAWRSRGNKISEFRIEMPNSALVESQWNMSMIETKPIISII